MFTTVAERGKYWYNYTDYLSVICLSSFCCCLVSKREWFQRRIKRLKRHQDASERLSKEIDIVKILYSHRISQLVAKLTLKKHQRALVSSFKQYQLDDMIQVRQVTDEDQSKVEDSSNLLIPSIQTNEQAIATSDPGIEKIMEDELLTDEQMNLLNEILLFFDPRNIADSNILYECTGYKSEQQDESFWEDLKDFEALGDTKLTRADKDETIIAKVKKTAKVLVRRK